MKVLRPRVAAEPLCQVSPMIEPSMNKHKRKNQASAGGALATLCAIDLVRRFPDVLQRHLVQVHNASSYVRPTFDVKEPLLCKGVPRPVLLLV